MERVSSELGMRLYKTSVKEDMGVSSVFQHLAENYVAKVKSFNDELFQVSSKKMQQKMLTWLRSVAQSGRSFIHENQN